MGVRLTERQLRQAKRAFLEHFAKNGNISAACRYAGIESRQTVYNWQEHDEQFAFEFREAEVNATEVLEAEAWRRAVEGVPHERTTYWRGEVSGTDIETKYSDTLLITLLKARAPEKYAERTRSEISGPGGQPIQVRTYVDLTDDDLDAKITELQAEAEG